MQNRKENTFQQNRVSRNRMHNVKPITVEHFEAAILLCKKHVCVHSKEINTCISLPENRF